MTDHAPNHNEEDKLSLLDILVTLAESWKLLIFGPLIAGIFAGALSFLLPTTFESVAVVRLAESEVALLHTAPVLDPLIEQFGLLAKAGDNQEDARQGLRRNINFTIDKKTKLASITIKAETQNQAQVIGLSAIAALLKELQVKGQEKVLLEKTIAINERAIGIQEDAIEAIQRSLKKSGLSDQFQESAVKNLAAINSDISKRLQENEMLRQKLAIKGEEIFVQQPSLPQRKASPNRGMFVLLALLASGLALLLFVFISKVWSSAAKDELAAAKINQIKIAFIKK